MFLFFPPDIFHSCASRYSLSFGLLLTQTLWEEIVCEDLISKRCTFFEGLIGILRFWRDTNARIPCCCVNDTGVAASAEKNYAGLTATLASCSLMLVQKGQRFQLQSSHFFQGTLSGRPESQTAPRLQGRWKTAAF